MVLGFAALRSAVRAPLYFRPTFSVKPLRYCVSANVAALPKTFNGSVVRAFSGEVNRAEFEERVLNVCKAYDRINAEKLNLGSHFINDLGLDSLDHIEVIMEIENEFGLEIPDVEAEKLMTPAQIVEMLYQKKVRKSKIT
ncbi:unnamed protein product [Hydatigera taeniaeformis]|uniref:Acyl carrier protein n=1 Tax=Hydatigena taeniaeformis TaxID=6205 RepID=A0A0R3WQZ1_HYDTA|nr:unnamed protein product [Hydatigera taeniaeformis]